MRRYVLTIVMGLLSLCAFAQGDKPTTQELDETCTKLTQSIEYLSRKLPLIKKEVQRKVAEKSTGNITIPPPTSTDSILKKAKQVIYKVQELNKEDSLSNEAPKALKIVYDVLGSFTSAFFSDSSAAELQIKDDFEQILQDGLDELNQTLSSLEAIENGYTKVDDISVVDENHTDDKEESLNIFKIIEPICLLILLSLIIISHLQLKSKYSKVQDNFGHLQREYDKLSNLFKEELNANKQRRGINITPSLQPTQNLTTEDVHKIVRDELNSHFSKKENVSVKQLSKQYTPQKENIGKKNPTTEVCLYGQLQNDGSFKVSMEDTRYAFFIIKLKDNNATQGEFTLKSMDTETEKAVITNRQMSLSPACETLSTSSNPSKIIVETPGTVEKQGNRWVVLNKTQIKLENA